MEPPWAAARGRRFVARAVGYVSWHDTFKGDVAADAEQQQEFVADIRGAPPVGQPLHVGDLAATSDGCTGDDLQCAPPNPQCNRPDMPGYSGCVGVMSYCDWAGHVGWFGAPDPRTLYHYGYGLLT